MKRVIINIALDAAIWSTISWVLTSLWFGFEPARLVFTFAVMFFFFLYLAD